MNLGDRIFRLIRSNVEDKVEAVSKIFEQESILDREAPDINGAFYREEWRSESWKNQKTHGPTGSSNHEETSQLEEDLKIFGLSSPTTMEAVRRARNKELKKYHPDKYANEPEKQEIAKQVMQIYNTAYDRIKENLGESSKS